MSFKSENINNAIVETQKDLESFTCSFGLGVKKGNPENLFITTMNFMNLAILNHETGEPTDQSYVNYNDSSFDEYLEMCQKLSQNCDETEKEEIREILLKILEQSNEMKFEITEGKREPSIYLEPLKENFCWGKVMLSLVQAFEVPVLEKIAVT